MSRPHNVTVIVTIGYLTICAIAGIFIHNLKGDGMAKYRIKEMKSGHWSGYAGVKKVAGFTTEAGAREWLLDMISPVNVWGKLINPVTGEPAPPGKMWIRNIMSDVWVLESNRAKYTNTVASETYWCM